MAKKASVGEIIEWVFPKYGITMQGVVLKEHQNSVIVIIENHELYRGLEIPDMTVVNHKKYKIVRSEV